MTSLLLWKERLKSFCNRYSYAVQPVIRFLFTLCTFLSLDANTGYMNKLRSLLVVTLVCLVSVLLPYGAIVFPADYLLVAYVHAVSLRMALIILALILTVAILYYGFKPGDSYLIVLTPLTSLSKIPYVVPLLVGLGGSLVSVIPVGCDVFLYYLIMHVRQNTGVLTNDAAVDIVQGYSQILRSVIFSQTVMMMITACAVGTIIVYLIHRLSMGYSWTVATAAGSVTEFLVIFVGDFVSGVTATMGQPVLDMLSLAVIMAIYNFLIFTTDYTRTEHVQFEDNGYYYYVKVVPKMNVSTPGVKIQKISTRKYNTRERSVY